MKAPMSLKILIMTNFPLYPIQLWWQFFPNVCLWRRSLCSNLAGIDSEKLYQATFICQCGLFCCMALVSFRLFCKNLGNLQEFFGQMDYRPPWQKIAHTPMIAQQLCKDPYWICQHTGVADKEEDFVQDLKTYFFTSAAASINRRWVAKSKATVRVAYKKNTYC